MSDITYFVTNRSSRIDTHILDRAIIHACEYLGILKLVLEIEYVSDEPKGFFGDADVHDGVAYITLNKRLNLKNTIITLFHEMVHVCQMLRGDLVIGEGGRNTVWRNSDNGSEYRNTPWEREAYELEQILYDTFDRTLS